MKRRIILVLLLLAGINTATAAIVTSISNLLIDGTRYDVTIHTSGSFNDIWDSNGDGIFGNDSSGLNRAPTFWGNITLAEQAQQAVMDVLGTVDVWRSGTDKIMTPFARHYLPNPPYIRQIDVHGDSIYDPASDSLSTYSTLGADLDYTKEENYFAAAYVSYTPSVVPIPAAVWLFGSGLLGLIGFSRRRKAVD